MSMPDLSQVHRSMQMQNNPMFNKPYQVYLIEAIKPIDITDYYISYLDESLDVIIRELKDMHGRGINIDGLTSLFNKYKFSQLKITCLDKFTCILDARGSVLYHKQKYRYKIKEAKMRFNLIRLRNEFMA